MDKTSSKRILKTAEEEIVRAMDQARIPGHPPPYFVSYLIRDEESWRIQSRYGALITDTHERKRHAFADVRVGSHRYDHVRDGGLLDNDKDVESYAYVDLPYGGNLEALRHGLWRLTDGRYREAVESLLDKRSHELTYRDVNRHLQAFERRQPAVHDGWRAFPEVDRDYWRRYTERTSRSIRRFDDIKDGHVEFQVEQLCRIFVSSEGARQLQCESIWSVECYLWLLSERGDAFPWTIKHTVTDPEELPGEAQLVREIRAAAQRLRTLAAAPKLRSFCGPALLEPVPAGLLIHEAVGHRLEGTRLLSAGEGQTFKDAMGKSILTPILSIRDNPGLDRFEGRSLVGHYRFDDEGVEAQDAELVRGGTLTGFLTTRTGVTARHRSNGHARCAYHQRPISRMGVTLVEADDGLDDAALRERFLEEIRRSNAPFGMRIIEASSGETATDAYNFQAFLGEVNLAHRVYPDGREEPIRGLDFIGTPLNAIRGIVAAGRRREVDNAYCGAESGYVPVSTISPALVVAELEMQSKPDTPYTQYTFPMPWEKQPRPAKRSRGPMR